MFAKYFSGGLFYEIYEFIKLVALVWKIYIYSRNKLAWGSLPQMR